MDDIYIEYGSMRLMVIDLEIVLNDHSIVVHEKYILVMPNKINMIDLHDLKIKYN